MSYPRGEAAWHLGRTVAADRRTRCGYCGAQIVPGDEISFGEIKNKNRTPPERTVPICLRCWERAARDAGLYTDA